MNDDKLVERIMLGDEKAAEELINAIIRLFYAIVKDSASIWRKRKI